MNYQFQIPKLTLSTHKSYKHSRPLQTAIDQDQTHTKRTDRKTIFPRKLSNNHYINSEIQQKSTNSSHRKSIHPTFQEKKKKFFLPPKITIDDKIDEKVALSQKNMESNLQLQESTVSVNEYEFEQLIRYQNILQGYRKEIIRTMGKRLKVKGIDELQEIRRSASMIFEQIGRHNNS